MVGVIDVLCAAFFFVLTQKKICKEKKRVLMFNKAFFSCCFVSPTVAIIINLAILIAVKKKFNLKSFLSILSCAI